MEEWQETIFNVLLCTYRNVEMSLFVQKMICWFWTMHRFFFPPSFLDEMNTHEIYYCSTNEKTLYKNVSRIGSITCTHRKMRNGFVVVKTEARLGHFTTCSIDHVLRTPAIYDNVIEFLNCAHRKHFLVFCRFVYDATRPLFSFTFLKIYFLLMQFH